MPAWAQRGAAHADGGQAASVSSAPHLHWISPMYSLLSLDADRMMGSSGWKATSLMEPAWPGSLYSILLLVVSHTYTNLSAEPAAILLPSGDQEHLRRFCNDQ